MQVIRQAIKKESRPTGTAFGIDNISYKDKCVNTFRAAAFIKGEAQPIIGYLRLKIKNDI